MEGMNADPTPYVDQFLRVVGVLVTDWRTFAVALALLLIWRGPALLSAWRGK